MKAENAKSEATVEEGEEKEEGKKTRDGEKMEEAEDGIQEESETSKGTKGAVEEGADSSAKRERETDGDLEDEEELDDTPPMYRQARALFL